MPEDNVKHPKHYTSGIEMWDYAYSHGLDFFEGNIVKYICRWKTKNGYKDLLKVSIPPSFSINFKPVR